MPSTTFLAALATAWLALAVASPATAATQTVSVVVDAGALTEVSPGFFGVQYAPPFSPMAPFSLSVGDSVVYTVSFLPGQALTVAGPTAFWAFTYTDNASGAQQTTGTGTLQLLDTHGNTIYTSNSLTSTEGDAHFGQYFFASLFPDLPSSVSIGGVRYSGTVQGFAPTQPGIDPVVTSRTYVAPAFYLGADAVAVPEPGSALALALGLAVLGAARWRSAARDARQAGLPALA
jgi:hypothetical protein